MGGFLDSIPDWAPSIVEGVDRSIQKYRDEISAKEKENLKRLQDIEAHKQKLKISHDFKTNPINAEEVGAANHITNATELKYNVLNNIGELEGIIEGQKTAVAKETEVKHGERVVDYDANGEPITWNMYNNMVEVNNDVHKLDLENRAGKPIITQQTEMLQVATKLGIPRQLWGNDYNMLAQLIKDENLRIAALTKKIELKAGLELSEEVRYGPLDPYWDSKEGREEIAKYGTNNSILQGNIKQTMDRFGIVKLINVDRNERIKMINDFTSVVQGYNHKVSFNEDTLEKYNTWARENGLRQIGEDNPYILFKTEGHEQFKDMRKNEGAQISMYTQLINQFTAMPDVVFDRLDARKQEEISTKVKTYMMTIQRLLGKTKIVDGQEAIDVRSKVNLRDLGITYNSSPKWLLATIENHTSDNTPGNNAATANSNTDSLDINSTDVSLENKNRVLLPVLFNGQSATDEEFTNAAIMAHAIRTDNNAYTDYNIPKVKKAISSASTYPEQVVGAYIWKDVLFENGTMQLRPTLPNPNMVYQAVYKADLYGKKIAESGPAARVGGMDFDPYVYYNKTAQTMWENLNGEIISSDPAFSAWKNQQDKAMAGTGSVGVYSFLDDKWITSQGIKMDKAQEAAQQSANAYQAGILLLDNIRRTGVASALVSDVARLLDGLKEFPVQLRGALGNYLNSNGGEPVTLAALGGDVTAYINELVSDGSLTDENAASLMVAAGTVGKFGDEEFDETQFQQGLTDIANGNLTDRASTSALLAQQKMYHAALVFYAAAAFQGEGGKAISDGDRKFVEWALNYGSFTTKAQREFAIQGMMKIISKARMINTLISSNDPRKVYVAMHYNDYFGDNVITAEEMPAQILEENPWVVDAANKTSGTGGTLLNMQLKSMVDRNYVSPYEAGREKVIQDGTLGTDKNIILPSSAVSGLASQDQEKVVMQDKKLDPRFALTIGNNSIAVEVDKITKDNIAGLLNWISQNGGGTTDYENFKSNIPNKFHTLVDDYTKQGVR